MHSTRFLFFLFSFLTTIYAIALPAPFDSFSESASELFKRKGGGGGGGRGGGSSSGGSSSGGSSSGGSRGSGSGSGSSSGSSRTSPSSNMGGSTSAGSGTTRGYSNGQYYGGGASVPYTAGSSTRSITPYLLGGAALGVLPGIWLYGAWAYTWPHGYYTWHNNTNNQNETGPVECLCGEYSACGCDENNSTDYLTSVANNGSIAQRSSNGTLYINGTLDNGTTAPGGTDAASGLKGNIIQMPGLALLVAGVVFTVYC